MKNKVLFVLLFTVMLMVGYIYPAKSFALEYCWNLTYPGIKTPPETIRVGVLNVGNGHSLLAGTAMIPKILDPRVMNVYIVQGSAERVDKALEVSLTMSTRDPISLLPGGTQGFIVRMLIHMKLNPNTLSGDYARIIDGGNGPFQLKASFFDGSVTSTPCN